MVRTSKKELIDENIKLKSEIALLKQEILTLQSKLNYYQTIEKGIGDCAASASKFVGDCISGWNK
jgi:hypothetical protein